MVSLGSATIDINGDTTGLEQNVQSGLGQAFKRAAAAATVAFASVQIGSFLKDSVTQASDLGESINAMNVVLGSASESFLKFGENAANSLGLTQAQLNQNIVPIAAGLKNAGLQGDQLSQAMQQLATRAADVGSVFNTDVNQVLADFAAGLRGEADPVEKYGVKLSAAAIEAKALAMGLASSKDELTDQQKTIAAYNLLLDQTAVAQGDFAKTSDSVANAARIIKANFEEMKAQLGSALLPAVQQVQQGVLSVVQSMGPALATIGQTIGAALTGLAPVISSVLGTIALALEQVRPAIEPLAAAFGALVQAFLPLVPVITQLIVTAFVPLANVLAQVLTYAQPFIQGFAYALQAALTQLAPALAPLAQAFIQVGQAIISAILPVLPQLVPLFVELLMAVIPLIPAVLQLIVAFTPLIAPLTQLALIVLPPLTQALALVAGIIAGPVTGALLAIINPVVSMVAAFLKIDGVLKTIAIALGVIAAPLAIVATALMTVAAVGAVVGAVAAAPFVAVGAAIAVLVALIIKYHQQILGAITAAWNAVKGVVMTAVNAVKGAVSAAWSAIAGATAAAWRSVVSAVSGPLSALRAVITAAFNGYKAVITAVLSAVRAVVVGAWNAIRGAISTAMNAIRAVISAGWAVIRTVVTTALAAVRAVVTTAWAGIRAVITTAMAAIRAVITTAWAVIRGVVSAAMAVLRSVISAGWAAIRAVVTAAMAVIRAVVTTQMNGLRVIVGAAMAAIRAVFSTAWAAVRGVVTAAINAIRAVISTQMAAIRAVVSSAIEGVKAAFAGIRAVIGVITSVMSSIKSAVTDGINAVVGFFRALPGQILGAIPNPGGLLFDAGKAILGGFIDGLKSMVGGIKDTLGGITDLIPDWKGPKSKDQKLLTPTGRWIMQGFIRGLEAEYPAVKSTLRKLTADTPGAVVAGLDKALRAAEKKLDDKKLTGKARARQQALVKGLDAAAKEAREKVGRLNDALGSVGQLFDKPVSESTERINELRAALRAMGVTKFDKQLAAGARQLDSWAKTLDVVRERLDAARGEAKRLRDEASDFNAEVKTSFLDFGNVADMAANGGFKRLRDNLKLNVDQAKKFAAAMLQLRASGLNETALRQLTAAGPDALKSAEALLAGGAAGIAEINTLQQQLGAAGADLGGRLSYQFYAAGIAAADGLVRGLQSQEAVLMAAMTRLADQLVNTIKKKLKIKSPSKVFETEVGIPMPQGAAKGVRRGTPDLTAAVARMAQQSVAFGAGAVQVNGVSDPEAARRAGILAGQGIASVLERRQRAARLAGTV